MIALVAEATAGRQGAWVVSVNGGLTVGMARSGSRSGLGDMGGMRGMAEIGAGTPGDGLMACRTDLHGGGKALSLGNVGSSKRR